MCTCSFDIREGAKNHMTDYYNFCIGTEFCSFCLKSLHLCCLILLRVFLPRRLSWPSNLVRQRTTVLFVSDLRHGFPRLLHDWNCMSVLSIIVHLICIEKILPRQLRSDQYEVLQTSSILNNSFVNCFWQFLGRTKAKTVWSWTESFSFDLYNPSKIISVWISLADNRAWSHRTSKSWTSSFCKRTLNKSESHCTASISSGCTEMLVDHVSNVCGRSFEHAAFCGSEHACRARTIIDRDVVSSSIDFAISTSLTQCVVRWVLADFEHTLVLKLTFQLWNSIESGNFPTCISEIGNLV